MAKTQIVFPEEWTDQMKDCRLNRHHWPGRQSVVYYPQRHYYDIRQDCGAKCGVYRTNEMDEEGWLLLNKWHPHYPPGYLRKKGAGRMTADMTAALRLARTLTTAKIKEVKDE